MKQSVTGNASHVNKTPFNDVQANPQRADTLNAFSLVLPPGRLIQGNQGDERLHLLI
jgi:hypothetical protein